MLGVPVENEKDETVHTSLCEMASVLRRGRVGDVLDTDTCLAQQMSSRDVETTNRGRALMFFSPDTRVLGPRGYRRELA